MSISQIASFSYKKLKSYRLKTVFLVLPIALLLMVGTLLTTEAQNIQRAIDQHVIGTLQKQSQFIQITQKTGPVNPSIVGSAQQQPYNGGDIQRVKSMEGVSKAGLGASVPLGRVVTTDLVSGHTLNLNSVTALESELSAQFAERSTAYDGSGAIPIVLSASQFQEITENWQGKSSIQVTMSPPSSGGPTTVDPNKSGGPVGTHAVPYDRQSLIGKEFTVTIGGLQPLQDYGVEPGTSFGQLNYSKYDADKMAQKESDRKTAISSYWDYDKLSAPKIYTFKVAGIIDDLNSQTAYIPPRAADQLMRDEIQKQLDSRTSAEIPVSKLATFTGLTFDGTTISVSAAASGNAMIGGSTSVTYPIPGFVTKTDMSGQTSGLATDPDVYKQAIPTATSIVVKMGSIYDRPKVITALNDAGYAYQDTSKFAGLIGLRQKLSTAVTAFVWLFGGLVVSALVLAFTRFVAESRREIGIFRALGATKGGVGGLFTGQALLAGTVSWGLGLLLGVASVFAIAPLMTAWFNNVVRDAVSQSVLEQSIVTSKSFMEINWNGAIVLSILLWCAIVITACVASAQAARVSPADAVRSDS